MVASAITAVVFGSTTSWIVFAIAYGVNGYFQATGWPNNVRGMAAWFGTRSRGKVMGFWCTCYQVGGLVATALAGWLLAHHGWQSAFFVPAIIVAAVGIAIWVFLVEKPQDRGFPPIDPPAPAGADGRAPKETAPFLEMIRIPAIWILGASYFGLKLIRYSLLFWLAYYLNHRLHYSEETSAYVSTSFEAGGIVGAVATGWVSDRYFAGRRSLLAAPMVLLLSGALLVFVLVGARSIVTNVSALALVGFFLFGPDALISGAAAQDLGGSRASGSAAGIINGIGSAGAILEGVITVGVSDRWGWDGLFYVFVAIAFVSGLVLLPLGWMRTTRAAAS